MNQPERARKGSAKTPDDRLIVNSREVCGRIGTRFRRREGKGGGLESAKGGGGFIFEQMLRKARRGIG
jgi:hypothetical protein